MIDVKVTEPAVYVRRIESVRSIEGSLSRLCMINLKRIIGLRVTEPAVYDRFQAYHRFEVHDRSEGR